MISKKISSHKYLNKNDVELKFIIYKFKDETTLQGPYWVALNGNAIGEDGRTHWQYEEDAIKFIERWAAKDQGCLVVQMDTTNIFNKIVNWAEDRNLIKGASRQAQMLKLTEEVGELAAGIAKVKEDVVKDSIGDCVVVLTIIAAQSGLHIEDCINAAYNEIKDGKGKMVDGVFVREE